MDLKEVEPVVVEGRIRIPYRWPAGQTGGHFLSLLQTEGRLTGRRCPHCRKVYLPPRPRCLACRVPNEEWVSVGPEGTVTTWTVSRRTMPPTILALVKLDGADTSLLTKLIDVDPENLQSGVRVTAVLQEERHGQITDLIGFRPL